MAGSTARSRREASMRGRPVLAVIALALALGGCDRVLAIAVGARPVQPAALRQLSGAQIEAAVRLLVAGGCEGEPQPGAGRRPAVLEPGREHDPGAVHGGRARDRRQDATGAGGKALHGRELYVAQRVRRLARNGGNRDFGNGHGSGFRLRAPHFALTSRLSLRREKSGRGPSP